MSQKKLTYLSLLALSLSTTSLLPMFDPAEHAVVPLRKSQALRESLATGDLVCVCANGKFNKAAANQVALVYNDLKDAECNNEIVALDATMRAHFFAIYAGHNEDDIEVNLAAFGALIRKLSYKNMRESLGYQKPKKRRLN